MTTTVELQLLEPELDTSLVVPEEIAGIRDAIARYRRGRLETPYFRRLRLQNGIYSVRNQEGIQMVRVKVPFGRLTAGQLEKLGVIAETYANSIGHVTTRQDLQFYWIPLERIPDLLQDLAEVGLTTREASGNVVRNVTCDPLAGVAPDEAFDVRPYANAVARYLLRNPIAQNLGRKFKIALSGSPADRASAAINDIGAIAALRPAGGLLARGFKIFVGGGLGANPRLAQPLEDFTPEDQLLPTVEAIIRIFNRLGDRKHKNKARMKFLVQQLGLDAFRELVFEERAVLAMLRSCAYPEFTAEHTGWINPPVPVTPPSNGHTSKGADASNFHRWLKTNVIWQKQPGYAAAYVTLPAGDITADQFGNLAQIARQFAGGEAFTTITQNLVFHWVPETSLEHLYQALQAIGLGEAGVHRLRDIIGCPGADTCSLGLTTSQRLALELARWLAEQRDLYLTDDLKGIDIKISGCPNSCGHHHVAAIGFYGGARRVNGQLAPHYRMLLGGCVLSGSAVLGTPVASIPAKNVLPAVARVVELYRAGRDGDESFHDWLARVGAASLRNEFEDLQILPDPIEAPDLYRDWGQDFPFTVQVGENECAA